jgi:hypothetical protein
MAKDSSKTSSRTHWTGFVSMTISLFAFMVSGMTFYLLYLDRGTIEVSLNNTMAVYFEDGAPWTFTVYAILYNTGSPHKTIAIEDVKLKLDLNRENEILATWSETMELLPETEYVRLYGRKRLPEAHYGYPDYFVTTTSKPLPFTLPGRESVSKWFRLRSVESIDDALAPLYVEAILEVKTISGKLYRSNKRVYYINSEDIAKGKQTKTNWWVFPPAFVLTTE